MNKWKYEYDKAIYVVSMLKKQLLYKQNSVLFIQDLGSNYSGISAIVSNFKTIRAVKKLYLVFLFKWCLSLSKSTF